MYNIFIMPGGKFRIQFKEHFSSYGNMKIIINGEELKHKINIINRSYDIILIQKRKKTVNENVGKIRN